MAVGFSIGDPHRTAAECFDTLEETFRSYASRDSGTGAGSAGGLGNEEVGNMLGTAADSVKAHAQSILSKLSAKDGTQAVSITLRRGIIHVHSADVAAAIPNG